MSLLEEAPTSPPIDAARLAELEAVVADGLDRYVRVGRALTEIHDDRLFLAVALTRKRYLEDR